jgi:predicted aspartyl protease
LNRTGGGILALTAAMRTAAIVFVAVLVPALAGCQLGGEATETRAPVDAAEGEVPLAFAGAGEAALVVPVRINGAGPFSLVLDTGATFTCVTTEVAAQLDLPEQRGAVGRGTGVHATMPVRIIRFDSVRVGAASAHDMPGCVLDLTALEIAGTSVDGLLGLNFLRAFDVHLDFRRNVLTLTAASSD